jgi:hypothetical protein
VLIGYMRVLKADWSQVLDLQRDALLETIIQTIIRSHMKVH